MTEQERVEKVADALAEHCHEPRGVLLMMARAAIAALTVTPQEAAKVLLGAMGPKDLISEDVMDLFWEGSPFTALRAISEDSQ